MKQEKGKGFQAEILMIRRGFALIHQLRPRLITYGIFMAVFRALTPFVNIYMTALILNELLGSQNVSRLVAYAAAVVALNWVFGMLNDGFVQLRNERMIPIWALQTHMLSRKMMDMDFANLEDPHTHELEQSVYARCMYMGRTLWSLQEQAENILGGFIGVAVSIGMTASLFVSSGNAHQTGFLAFVDSFWFSGIIILLILASVFLSMRMNIIKNKNITKVLEDKNFSQADRLGWHFQDYLEDYRTGKDVRLYNQGGLILGKIWEGVRTVSKGMDRWAKVGGRYNSVQAAVSSFLGGVVYLFVPLKALSGVLSIGSVVQYTGSITQFISNFTLMATNFSQMRTMAVDFGIFFDYLDLPDRQKKGGIPIKPDPKREYCFEFKNVSFAYPGVKEYALKNVSMKFQAGERLAIVGLNGSGKTTLIKLLCRLYDPVEGEILLNGVNIKEYDYAQYQELFSVVFQDYKLFSLPVGENIAASMEYNEEKVLQCLRQAGLEEWVDRHKDAAKVPLYKDCFHDGEEI